MACFLRRVWEGIKRRFLREPSGEGKFTVGLGIALLIFWVALILFLEENLWSNLWSDPTVLIIGLVLISTGAAELLPKNRRILAALLRLTVLPLLLLAIFDLTWEVVELTLL